MTKTKTADIFDCTEIYEEKNLIDFVIHDLYL